MFAVVKTGGKQYRVEKGDVLHVEKLEGDQGASLKLDSIMMCGEGEKVTLGKPTIDGAWVDAEILEQKRADKIVIFKKIRRHGYRRKNGHRQYQTVLRIKDIHVAA
jgi:large subunit ribosomal protein L21